MNALQDRFHSLGLFFVRLSFPCLPSSCEWIVDSMVAHLRVHGRSFDAAETADLAETVLAQLQEGYAVSPLATLTVEMANDPAQPHKIRFAMRPQLAEGYANWEAGREFGNAADLAVLALAQPGMRVLDVGAGTGRNAVALRDAGCLVDAIELDAGFFAQLNQRIPAIHGDFFTHPLPEHAYDLILFAEVLSSHVSSPEALSVWLQRAQGLLAPGGRILASVFIAQNAVTRTMRELGAHVLTCAFTSDELQAALSGLSVESNEPVLSVERGNSAHWPNWFEAWALGRNLFALDEPPLSLRWMVLR